MIFLFFFFNDTATTEIYTLSLHDALPIYEEDLRRDELRPFGQCGSERRCLGLGQQQLDERRRVDVRKVVHARSPRSEEHTSELQSRQYLVCRLLLEKKNKKVYRM